MFHFRGGTYARDNYPGLPMLDLVTGVLLVVGIASIVRRRDRPGLFLLLLLGGTLLAGILSVSQEGPPYVYRASAAVVPAVLIAGIGLQRFIEAVEVRRLMPAKLGSCAWLPGVLAVTLAGALNLYEYFGLERRNESALRVMGSEHRLIGQAIQRTDTPVYLLIPGVYHKPPDMPQPGERYGAVNRNFPYEIFGEALSDLAVIYYSGRYDWRLDVAENFRNAQIHSITQQQLGTRLTLPVAILIHQDDARVLPALRERYHDTDIQEEIVRDGLGNESLTLVTFRDKPSASKSGSGLD
jgi:hypothetical protein